MQTTCGSPEDVAGSGRMLLQTFRRCGLGSVVLLCDVGTCNLHDTWRGAVRLCSPVVWNIAATELPKYK